LAIAMQQIADWLKKLGMSEYAERFAENDIEIDILPELTDHDLERLGVSLGHPRRRSPPKSSIAPMASRCS
jgi:SAM domain (Sterile alpha motif)